MIAKVEPLTRAPCVGRLTIACPVGSRGVDVGSILVVPFGRQRMLGVGPKPAANPGSAGIELPARGAVFALAAALALLSEGVPTVRGGAKWRPSSMPAAAGYKRRRHQRLGSLPDQNGSHGEEL